MRRLCTDVAARVPELAHVDMQRVGVGFSQARLRTRHGLYATLTPLRFPGGRLHALRRGKRWAIQRLYDTSGREMLYILSFYLPRFLDLPFAQKLNTTLHELWHIGPAFDGDLRRFAGRCYAHSHSRKSYDRQMDALVERYLAANPPETLYDFLRADHRQLVALHGPVYGTKIPAPKLVRID